MQEEINILQNAAATYVFVVCDINVNNIEDHRSFVTKRYVAIDGIICDILCTKPLHALCSIVLSFTKYFVTDIPPRTEYYKAYAKENFTFRCPGANENTLVEYLEWHSESKHKKVLEFHKDAGITYYHEWKDRVAMDKDYGLIFSNVTSSDTGDYICLINHRLLPDVMLRFTVIGEYNMLFISNVQLL